MRRASLILFLAISITAWAQTPTAGVSGRVIDQTGAVIPGATVTVTGTDGKQTSATSDQSGAFHIQALPSGSYTVSAIAPGFAHFSQPGVSLTAGHTLSIDVTLQVHVQDEKVNVQSERPTQLDVSSSSSAGSLIIKGKDLEALSDDPDELQSELQALAGPSAGPNGGQIYIDGFTGGQLPAESSIREVRINSNPLSPEHDRPGFGRVEIFTKPGTDTIHGQGFFQYNKELLNSRNPLLQQSTRPPYQQRMVGVTLTGPIKKQKASFGLEFERRSINENAFILATTLDSNLNFQNINQGLLQPQSRNTISPRLDYMINTKHTLVVRYQDTR